MVSADDNDNEKVVVDIVQEVKNYEIDVVVLIIKEVKRIVGNNNIKED